MDSPEASFKLKAGRCLRVLIQKHYRTQEEFAYNFNVDPRTVRRWLSEGIKDIESVQSISAHFGLSFFEFWDVAD